MRTWFFIMLYLFCTLLAQAQTTEKQIFFRGAGNLVVLSSDIEINDESEWHVQNGRLYENRNKREIIVCPDSLGKCKVWATLAGKNIWEDEYEVRPIPKKPVYYWANEQGDTINTTSFVPISINAKYQLCAKAEVDYAKNLGARYVGWACGWLYKGKKKRLAKEIRFALNEPIDLKTLGVRKGDALALYASVMLCQTNTGHYHHIPYSGYFYIYLE